MRAYSIKILWALVLAVAALGASSGIWVDGRELVTAAVVNVDGDVTLTGGGTITSTANGDILLKPHGTGLVEIGDDASPSYVTGDNGQLFVSDKFEVASTAYMIGSTYFYGSILRYANNGTWQVTDEAFTELVTIPVGQGAGGVVSSTNIVPAYSRVTGSMVRVTQAPGGGASTFTIGITGGAADNLITTTSTASDTTSKRMPDTENNGASTTITITTDSNVTGSDMVVRVVLFADYNNAPTS